MLPVPIFHVNGEYPQAVARVVELAMDFRTIFQRDVLIDMYSFRRLGHNEADEPSFTQPLVYQAIEHRPTVRDSYLKHLLAARQSDRRGSHANRRDRARRSRKAIQRSEELAAAAEQTDARRCLATIFRRTRTR